MVQAKEYLGKHWILSEETGLTSTQYKHYYIFERLICLSHAYAQERNLDIEELIDFRTTRKDLLYRVKQALWMYNKFILNNPDKTPERQAVYEYIGFLMLNTYIEEENTETINNKTIYMVNLKRVRESFRALYNKINSFKKGNNTHSLSLDSFNINESGKEDSQSLHEKQEAQIEHSELSTTHI
jgi:hypothetical protein